MLAAERVILNVLGRMAGVATATRRLVEAVAGSLARDLQEIPDRDLPRHLAGVLALAAEA